MKAASTLCKAPALAKRIVANHRNAPRRALHTALPAMASSNGQGGGSSSNLPAHRYSSQLAPIFGGMGSWPLTSRFRALEEEMEVRMYLIYETTTAIEHQLTHSTRTLPEHDARIWIPVNAPFHPPDLRLY